MYIKSLFWQMINNIIKFFLEIFVFDKKIRRILKGNWAKFYLRKYVKLGVGYVTNSIVHASNREKNPSLSENDNIHLPVIWQYWESSDGSVPVLVQTCMNSVEKYKGNCQRIILTYENIKDYIELPDFIYKMKESGKMCTAHFVDIIRTALLVKYGGIWIDATVLLTDIIPEYITNSELFFFRTDEKYDLDGLCGTNYFISAATPDNIILKEVLASMISYWKENSFLVNYYSHMHIITLVCKKHPDILKNIPFYSFYPVQQLQWELLTPFNETRWNQLKKMTSVHKLTYKTKILTKKKDFDINGTFYEYIINEFNKF